MTEAFVDAHVLIRLLTRDDPAKSRAVAALLATAERGEVTLHVAASTIAEVVFVLTSPRIYARPREEVAAAVRLVVELPYLVVEDRSVLIRALDLFAQAGKFGDALLLARMEREHVTSVYAYDRGYDRIPGITRREP